MAKKEKNKGIEKACKEYIVSRFRKHAWNIGVSNYQVDFHYMDEACESDHKDGAFDHITNAEINVDRRYLHATIKIYPKVWREMWEKGDKKRIDEVVAHETAHIATQHMMTLAVSCYKDEGETKDAWESLTEVVARLSCNLAEYKEKTK